MVSSETEVTYASYHIGPPSQGIHPMKAMLNIGFVILTLNSCGSQNANTHTNSSAWRKDLQHLAQELPLRHVKPFHTVSRKEFLDKTARLDATLSRINDDQRLVALMRIVALIGDGHTHLDLSPSYHRYPFELQWFGNELRVVAATVPDLEAIGARVTAIGSTSIQKVMTLASQLVPRGENDGRTRLTATMLLNSPEVLHGLEVTGSRESATFDLVLVSGKTASKKWKAAPPGYGSNWRLAVSKPPLFLQRLGQDWWTEFLPDTKTIYFSFNRYPNGADFRQRSEDLARQLDESHARRLVIDLRRNQGGDLTQFRQILLPILKSRPAVSRKGGLYVIIGPGTFSAATVNALDMRNEAKAILVGSPTGMRPTHYGEHGEFRLPNSGLRVSYSTRFYQFGSPTDDAVVPDKHLEQTWSQFRAGLDPAMDWIHSQP